LLVLFLLTDYFDKWLTYFSFYFSFYFLLEIKDNCKPS
jgi:hypothetical protein